MADKGLTDNVMAEIETSLDAHELVKIKLRGDRSARSEWVERIVERTGAEPVQRIGQVALLFRRNPENPKISVD